MQKIALKMLLTGLIARRGSKRINAAQRRRNQESTTRLIATGTARRLYPTASQKVLPIALHENRSPRPPEQAACQKNGSAVAWLRCAALRRNLPVAPGRAQAGNRICAAGTPRINWHLKLITVASID
jgi:hypothetical protein